MSLDSKPKGWHSRRHESGDAHREATLRRSLTRGRLNRREEAAERTKNYRTPEAQLEHLDKLFGVGQGAAKERAKLAARIAAPVPENTHNPETGEKLPKKGRQAKGKKAKS